MVIIKIIVGNPFLHLLRFHHLDKISYYDNKNHFVSISTPHHNPNPDWQCRHTFGDSISIQILQIERSRDGIARGRSGFNLLEGNSEEGQLNTMLFMTMVLLIH